MVGKIVLTEKGLKLSNELLIVNNDDPPPFLEEGKSIQKPPSNPKLANLFEESNGFLDRVTLKSAQSHRLQNINKPFFLPNYDVKEVQEGYPPMKSSKYPGIYPPPPPAKTSQGSRGGRNIHQDQQPTYQQQGIQQQTIQQQLKQTASFKDIPKRLSGLVIPGSHPLVLDYDSLTNQQSNDSNKHRRVSHLQSIFLNANQKQGDEGIFPIQSQGKRNSIGMTNVQSHQVNGTTHKIMSPYEDSPKKEGLNRFQFAISTKIDEIFKGSLSSSNKYTLNVFSQGKRKPLNKEQYFQSIKNRMSLKKQEYINQRDIQDKRLKEIAQKKGDLSKEPVHVAAKYLQELKQEDSVVENLAYDVQFFNTRYQNRLKEYHHQKYQKQWNQFYFPSDKKKQLPPQIIKNEDSFNHHLDFRDYYSQKTGLKSFQKQNNTHSFNHNIK